MSISKEIWIDQGGTFTDIITVVDGVIHVMKEPTPRALSLEEMDKEVLIRKGTTVATNALLEGTSRPVLLITNRGLGEVWDIGNQSRDKLFDLFGERRQRFQVQVLEINGRISSDGEVLERAYLTDSAIQNMRRMGFESVAIVLVHGILCPEEENRLAEKFRNAGFLYVSVGHLVSASIGLHKRLISTIADAALSPLLPRQRGLYMCTDGGLANHDSREWTGIRSVLSGPAGGAVAVADICSRMGISKAFGFDMGGTSSDLCHYNRNISRVDSINIDGIQLETPSIEIKTVAAGGGSILSEQQGMFRVGPRSVGSNPGPVCYGRGGTELSLTDVEAVLGLLVHFPHVCGPDYDMPLQIDLAKKQFQEQFPNMALEEVAVSFQQVAAEKMSTAIFRHAAEKNVEPSEYALVAFGGAGPAHACRVAECLGITKIVIPLMASVFSAFGIGIASKRIQKRHALYGKKSSAVEIMEIVEKLRNRVFESDLQYWNSYRQQIDIRLKYNGTGEGIWIQNIDLEEIECLEQRFYCEHERQFGYVQENTHVEWVEIKWLCEEMQVDRKHWKYPKSEAIASVNQRINVYCKEEGWIGIGCYSYDNIPMNREGPFVVLLDGSTVFVERGWQVQLQDEALIVSKPQKRESNHRYVPFFHPMQTAIFGMRIMCIAEQMGERLAKISRSVSIRERCDFSCAIFDAEGNLIANAPHVPVHLGAMGETIRSLINLRGTQVKESTVWMSNNPYLGGSHLPDITVMMPMFIDNILMAFVACRAHHIDVGGIQKGSMPPHSKNIEEEGVVFTHVKIHDGHHFLFRELNFGNIRQKEDVLADIQAQYSACIYGLQNLHLLFGQMGATNCIGQFQALLEHAHKIALDWNKEHIGMYHTSTVIDGMNEEIGIDIALDIRSTSAILELHASSSRYNFNMPLSVLKACLLYVLRSVIDEEIPLNSGFLNSWTIKVNSDGLCDPSYPRAVVAGNVETSQHIVDAIVRALGIQASSQGTMNNLVFSTKKYGSSYETIGGGAGAGDGRHGGSAVQLHMTNTKATDVEVLEHRFPIRVLQWKTRKNSGGIGKFIGGDGIVKEWLFLEPTEISLLATRRNMPPMGIFGGLVGMVGKDWVYSQKKDCWFRLNMCYVAESGDRLKIETPSGGGFGLSN